MNNIIFRDVRDRSFFKLRPDYVEVLPEWVQDEKLHNCDWYIEKNIEKGMLIC